MVNIYLQKVIYMAWISLYSLLFILLNSSNTYLKTYIMDYFMFDELITIHTHWSIQCSVIMDYWNSNYTINDWNSRRNSFRNTINKILGNKI